jgi:multiple sugar transport system ATP-binding protein
MAGLSIRGVEKKYGSVHAVRGVDLDVAPGEFAVLVGPSGCGKTTLLRTIAGLEDVTAGRIALGGREIQHAEPRDRNVAMVFQNYALYPYLTVFDNIAFPLKARKIPKPEIKPRVRRAAEMLDIELLLDRYPRELSGGQRQRVAPSYVMPSYSCLMSLYPTLMRNCAMRCAAKSSGSIRSLVRP